MRLQVVETEISYSKAVFPVPKHHSVRGYGRSKHRSRDILSGVAAHFCWGTEALQTYELKYRVHELTLHTTTERSKCGQQIIIKQPYVADHGCSAV
jgi:hypothetical protein